VKKILFSLLFVFGGVFAQSPVVTQTHNIPDDGYVHVPLQFGFPYYGNIFTNSWMFDNGVVGFMDPITGSNGGQQYWAEQFNNNMGPRFHYMIAPLWTDLLNYGSGSYITEGNDQFQRYTWQNISQYGYPDRLNTFSLEIQPSGFIGVNYELINVQGYPISTGTIGNASLGEWTQQQFYNGSQPLGLVLPNWSVGSTGAYDPCPSDPLSSPSCPGYTQAYFNQQCSISTLYDPLCPGYAVAYLEYQCSLSPLYSTTCLGYEQAYFNQQCSLDPLYNKECPGYAEEYAKKNIINKEEEKIETVVVAQIQQEIQTPTVSVSPADPVAPVQLIDSSPAPTSTVMTETKTESKSTQTETKTESKPTTRREQLAQQRREAAQKEVAENSSQELETVTSMEAQVQVQNIVIGAMGFVPGFDVYNNLILPDSIGYKPFEIYKGQQNVDNRRLIRGLTGGTDRTHREMTEQQYMLGR
jgi:hypothetical protein